MDARHEPTTQTLPTSASRQLAEFMCGLNYGDIPRDAEEMRHANARIWHLEDEDRPDHLFPVGT